MKSKMPQSHTEFLIKLFLFDIFYLKYKTRHFDIVDFREKNPYIFHSRYQYSNNMKKFIRIITINKNFVFSYGELQIVFL